VTGAYALDAGGLRVLVRPNPAHEAVAARFYVRGGAANQSRRTAGVEALYARTARRGTRRYAKEKLNATLAGVGAELGATAAHDYTAFTLRCLRRHLETTWDAFADVILDPTLEPAELEIVRAQMLLERRQALDSPDGALVETAREHGYVGHPYEANPQGTEESLPALDAAALRAHVERVLVRSNALLVLAGRVEPAAVERCAAAFARLPAGDGAVPLPPRLAYARTSLTVVARDLPTNYVLGEFTAPALGDADHAAMLIAMSVLRDRFFEEVRTKRNLSYAPSASLGSDAANLGAIYVTAVDPATTLGVMRAEIRRLAAEPLAAFELEHKVRTFVTRYSLQNESCQAQAGFLAAYELLGGGWQRADGMVARLEAVAPADVARVVTTYVRQVQYTYLGDPSGAEPTVFTDP
jgi:predicted Zn-dependent peptidase